MIQNKSESSSISKNFSSCRISPVTGDGASSSTVFRSPVGKYMTTSFFLDTSGRSKVSLPLELRFETKETLEQFVSAGCISPVPSGAVSGEEKDEAERSRAVTGFEVTTLSLLQSQSNDEKDASAVTVEGITVLTSWVDGTAVFFDTEVVLWAESFGEESGVLMNRSQIITDLEIVCVLSERRELDEKEPVASRLLDFGSVPDYIPHATSLFQQTRLDPILIQVSLTDALSISVKSINGASIGNTLVALTIRHSNTHLEPVTVTDIALHPGHSRLDTEESMERTNKKGHYSVMDMTKSVQWGYAPRTEPQLPLTLRPHDAFSTVIVVDAAEDTRSRTLVSPVTVAAVLGSRSNPVGTGSSHSYGIVASSDAKWTLGRVAFEPSDAFRIHMHLPQTNFHVGEPFTVSLRVLNLSSETRDLMLLVAKDIEKNMVMQKRSSVNTAVVSEVNGYTFGVWGLLADDDLKSRFDRDHDLLAVDTALLLGEVKGRASVQAQLRFNPLREGTLGVPNLQLFDKKNRKWYYCAHKLKIVATKSEI